MGSRTTQDELPSMKPREPSYALEAKAYESNVVAPVSASCHIGGQSYEAIPERK